MAIPFLRVNVKFSGIKGVKKRLARLKREMQGNLTPLARNVTQQLLSFVDKKFRRSSSGVLPAGWKRHSQLTRFVRANRATRRSKNPKVLLDTGLLRASNLPFIRKKGFEFGIENRLSYASMQNFGGVSTASTIMIGPFRRKKPSGGTTRVKGYSMTIKGGKTIPARPFFPDIFEVRDIVKRVNKDFEKRLAK